MTKTVVKMFFLVKLKVDSFQLYEEINFHSQVFLKIFIVVFSKKYHSILDEVFSIPCLNAVSKKDDGIIRNSKPL